MGNTTAHSAEPQADAAVIPLRPQYRALAYRYHNIRPRPGDGLAVTEYAIEQQLSRLLDEHPADQAVQLLVAWSPGLEPAEIEHLLTLAHEVYRAEVSGPGEQFYAAVDAYAAALRALAVKVRS